MQVIVDGLVTSYERQGSGRSILLLHGWGDRAAGLRGLQQELSKQFDVITPDLPGFGGTQTAVTPWGINDYAQYLTMFLQKLGITRLYGVIGHSNGGAIAMRAVASDALQPERLVLLASAGIRGEYNGRNKALRFLVKGGKALTLPLPAAAKRALRAKVYTTIGSDMLVAEHLQETFKRIVADDVRADARALAIPTLLIYGENDSATPVRYGELFHQLIVGSTLEILPNAGHFVHLDRPAETYNAIQEFLR